VAGLLLTTQARELVTYFDLGASRWFVYAAIPPVLLAAALRPRLSRARQARRATAD